MKSIVFYAIPFESVRRIQLDKLIKLKEVIDKTAVNGDSFEVPDEFHSFACVGENSFWEEAYSLDRDKSTLLLNLFAHAPKCAENYSDLRVKNVELIGYISDGSNVFGMQSTVIVDSIERLLEVYRYQSHFLDNFEELYSWHKRCFPALCFTKDSFNGVSELEPYHSIYPELFKSLSVLNDIGLATFLKSGEEQALRTLQSTTMICCTGKGRGEAHGFDKSIAYKDSDGRLVAKILSCIPHFKYIRADSNKRLYFSWGSDKIKNHSIIVAHAGGHWDKKVNGAYSEID